MMAQTPLQDAYMELDKLSEIQPVLIWQGRIEEFNCSFAISYAQDKEVKECDVFVTITYPKRNYAGIGAFGTSIDTAYLLAMIKDDTFIDRIKELYLQAEQEYAKVFCKTKH